jgi:hypothetical protein
LIEEKNPAGETLLPGILISHQPFTFFHMVELDKYNPNNMGLMGIAVVDAQI